MEPRPRPTGPAGPPGEPDPPKGHPDRPPKGHPRSGISPPPSLGPPPWDIPPRPLTPGVPGCVTPGPVGWPQCRPLPRGPAGALPGLAGDRSPRGVFVPARPLLARRWWQCHQPCPPAPRGHRGSPEGPRAQTGGVVALGGAWRGSPCPSITRPRLVPGSASACEVPVSGAVPVSPGIPPCPRVTTTAPCSPHSRVTPAPLSPVSSVSPPPACVPIPVSPMSPRPHRG